MHWHSVSNEHEILFKDKIVTIIYISIPILIQTLQPSHSLKDIFKKGALITIKTKDNQNKKKPQKTMAFCPVSAREMVNAM